jgi:ketosteroid isomerase-like protein
MRISCVLCFLLFSMPAVAADDRLKQEMDKVSAAYGESFNRQDGAGIAALYANGGIHVNPAGPRTDIARFFETAFKAGLDHEDLTVNEAWALGADTALSMGEYHITGKNQGGAPIELAGLWTATDVREGGKWKIRMMTAIPEPEKTSK